MGKPQRKPIRHGTSAGHQAHLRRGEKPCGPCRRANSIGSSASLIRSGRNQSVRVPVEVLGRLVAACPRDVAMSAAVAIGGPIVKACLERAARGDARG